MAIHGDRLEIRVLGHGGRTIHKASCYLHHTEKLSKLFSFLNSKFDLELEKMVKDKGWFNF